MHGLTRIYHPKDYRCDRGTHVRYARQFDGELFIPVSAYEVAARLPETFQRHEEEEQKTEDKTKECIRVSYIQNAIPKGKRTGKASH